MEHPTYEQLLAHLEGTSPAESAKKVKEHLQSCPECSAEIAGWQRTIKQLEKCEWPKPDQVRPGFSAAMPTWAVISLLRAMPLSSTFRLGSVAEGCRPTPGCNTYMRKHLVLG